MENKIFPFLKLWNKKKKSQLAFNDIVNELNDIKMCTLNVPKAKNMIKYTELNEIQTQTLKLFGITKKQFDGQL